MFTKILKRLKGQSPKPFQPPTVFLKGSLTVPEDPTKIKYVEPSIKYKIKDTNKKYLFEKPPVFDDYELDEEQTNLYYEEADRNQGKVILRSRAHPEEQIMALDLDQYMLYQQEEAEKKAAGKDKSDEAGQERKSKPKSLRILATILNPERYEVPLVRNDVMSVIIYDKEKKKSDDPTREDLGHDIVTKKNGYMLEADVKPRETFRAKRQVLFPHEPCLEDIEQAKMGDCFLLATLKSLLTKNSEVNGMRGADFIKSMMRQMDDGTTVVRFFHPATGDPIYVRVETSEHYTTGGHSAVRHAALWVHILEKAYAGLGIEYVQAGVKYHAIFEEKDQEGKVIAQYGITPSAFQTAYGGGGQEQLAATLITGKKAERVFIATPPIKSVEEVDSNPFIEARKKYNPLAEDHRTYLASFARPLQDVLYYAGSRPKEAEKNEFKETHPIVAMLEKRVNDADKQLTNDEFAQLRDLFYTDDKYFNPDFPKPEFMETSLYQAFFGNQKIDPNNRELMQPFLDWIIYYNYVTTFGTPDQANQLKTLFNLNRDDVNKPISVIQTEAEMLEIIDKLAALSIPPPQSVIEKFRAFVQQTETINGRQVHHFVGPLGSGQYASMHYQLYDKFEKLLQEGKVLAAGTKQEYSDKKDSVGIVDTHAYSIIGVKKKMINGKELLFVTLDNPWGKKGRAYDFDRDPPEITESKSGQFDMEFSDFMRLYRFYSVMGLKSREELGLTREQIYGSDYKKPENNIKAFVANLQKSEKKVVKTILQNESLNNLFLMIDHLERNEQDHQSRLLQQLRQEFNSRIKRSVEFPSIKANAKLYDQMHAKPKHNFLVWAKKARENVKTKFDLLMRKGKHTDHYVDMYRKHKEYLKDRKSLPNSYMDNIKKLLKQRFSKLKDSDKVKVVEYLKLKPNEDFLDAYLKTQSIQDIENLKMMVVGKESNISHAISEHLVDLPAKMGNMIKLAEQYLRHDGNKAELIEFIKTIDLTKSLDVDASQTIKINLANSANGAIDVFVEIPGAKMQFNVSDSQIKEFASRQYAKNNVAGVQKYLQTDNEQNEANIINQYANRK